MRILGRFLAQKKSQLGGLELAKSALEVASFTTNNTAAGTPACNICTRMHASV